MQIIKWLDIYEIKIPVIDNQHKELVFLLNDTYKAFLSKKNRDSIIGVALDKFLDLYSKHFMTEEKFMELVNFPLVDYHRDLHSEILSKLYNHKKKYERNKEFDIESFLTLTNQWLFSHLASEDMKIKDHLNIEDEDEVKKYSDEIETEK